MEMNKSELFDMDCIWIYLNGIEQSYIDKWILIRTDNNRLNECICDNNPVSTNIYNNFDCKVPHCLTFELWIAYFEYWIEEWLYSINGIQFCFRYDMSTKFCTILQALHLEYSSIIRNRDLNLTYHKYFFFNNHLANIPCLNIVVSQYI